MKTFIHNHYQKRESVNTYENGYVESFNGKLRDELLNGELFYSLRDRIG